MRPEIAHHPREHSWDEFRGVIHHKNVVGDPCVPEARVEPVRQPVARPIRDRGDLRKFHAGGVNLPVVGTAVDHHNSTIDLRECRALREQRAQGAEERPAPIACHDDNTQTLPHGVGGGGISRDDPPLWGSLTDLIKVQNDPPGCSPVLLVQFPNWDSDELRVQAVKYHGLALKSNLPTSLLLARGFVKWPPVDAPDGLLSSQPNFKPRFDEFRRLYRLIQVKTKLRVDPRNVILRRHEESVHRCRGEVVANERSEPAEVQPSTVGWPEQCGRPARSPVVPDPPIDVKWVIFGIQDVDRKSV